MREIKTKIKWALAVALLLVLWTGQSVAQTWRYEKSVDRMSGREAVYATLQSANSLALGFPYAGKNLGQITVRRHPAHGLDVLVRVEQGQILCPHDGCSVMVRFDGAEAVRYSASRASDGSSTVVFIDDALGFIERARKAKRILVQLELFRNGFQILEFKPAAGLTWADERPGAPKIAANSGPPVIPKDSSECERATPRSEGECGLLYAQCYEVASTLQQFPAARFMNTCLASGRAAAQAEFEARQAASEKQ